MACEMDHVHLVEKLLREIAGARAGIAANYGRLWRNELSREPAAGEPGPDDQAPEDRHQRTGEG